jgi:hypothetical protein
MKSYTSLSRRNVYMSKRYEKFASKISINFAKALHMS